MSTVELKFFVPMGHVTISLSCTFHLSLKPSIISLISSIEMNKMNLFSALTAPLFNYFFFSNLSNTEKVSLVNNLDKKSLTKGTAKCNNAFFLKLILLNVYQEILLIEWF